jgi:hypothetical protein
MKKRGEGARLILGVLGLNCHPPIQMCMSCLHCTAPIQDTANWGYKWKLDVVELILSSAVPTLANI